MAFTDFQKKNKPKLITMKTKKPTNKKVTSTVTTVLAVIAGMKLSKGVAGFIPVQNELAKKGILVGAGALAALFVDGEDMTSKIIQGIGAGMIVQQGSEAIDTAVQGSLPAPTTKATQAINAAFGGSAATSVSSTAALNGRRRRRSMGNPEGSVLRMGNAQPSYGSPTDAFIAG